MSQRVGLFGGTFDPPHHGHIAAVTAAVATGRFDHVEVTVAGDPYQKSADQRIHDAPTRLAMAIEAFGDINGVVVSDREIRRTGPSYTIDTVRELTAEHYVVDLLVGADVAERLDSWRSASELADLVDVGIFPRPGSSVRVGPRWRSYVIDMEPVDLSSTLVRDEHRRAAPIEDFSREEVINIFRDLEE